MKMSWKKFVTLLGIASMNVGIGAQAACWTPQEAEAAQVRDMETMLMVASLRCRLSGQNFMTNYNAFVRESRPALSSVNERLRTHFGSLDGYDRYVTGVANRYGAGADGLTCRDMASIVSAARSEKGSVAGLAKLAKSSDIRANLPGGLCAMRVAQVR
jgi:hypothetical protein